MLLVRAEEIGRDTILAHYDALLVRLFGAKASGLSEDRINELVKQGHLEEEALQGLDIAPNVLDEPLNPILFVRRLGSHYIQADLETREKMRSWDLKRWSRRMKQPLAISSKEVKTSFPNIERPQPIDLSLTPKEDDIPSSFGDAEKAGLVSAFKCAGGYIRGLGATYADEFSALMYEDWNGEQILSTPDPQRRADKLKVIREEVGTAVLTKDTAREVAGRIRQRVGDLARDFERIAETEIQAVHNEGQIYAGIELDGENAMIARIPESGACGTCLELFIDPLTNAPRVFFVSDIAQNGTNVGQPRRSWRATVYPIHPYCRCDTISVRPNQTVTRTGRVVVKK
jgi:hypothetical protein